MQTRRTRCWGLAVVAGLAWLCPATAARAQVSMGYDSLVYGYPPAQSFYYSSGYEAVYTDPSTGVYMNGQVVPPRTVAPYVNPPYGSFSAQGNGYPSALNRGPAMYSGPAPTRAQTVRQRRSLLIRRKK